jgi:hypothetical protein
MGEKIKMAKYTKGQWVAHCLGSEGFQVRLNNEGIPARTIKENHDRLTPIVEVMGGSFETQEANANLISAAPDMYEILKIIVEQLNEVGSVSLGDLSIAVKALNKAEGK